MARMLPFALPLLLTLIFVFTASFPYVFIIPLIIIAIGYLNKLIGKYNLNELTRAYVFFHTDPRMAWFKSFNGLFFIGFNIWVIYFFAQYEFSFWHYCVVVYCIILINSNFAIALAHDLMHSAIWADRLLAKVLLLQNGFFYLEADHIYIHHRYVGTPKDPATALLGEPVYLYFIRSVSARLKFILFATDNIFPKKGKNIIMFKTWLNIALCGVYAYIVWALGGLIAFICIILQFFFVIMIYESITYIQHYGLQRNCKAGDLFDHVNLQHSWNCFYKLSSYLHFMMPVHSIHHLKDGKAEDIKDFAGPSMPLPFAKMMLYAFIPFKWFRLMNARAELYNNMGRHI